jgi:hypothetical protein
MRLCIDSVIRSGAKDDLFVVVLRDSKHSQVYWDDDEVVDDLGLALRKVHDYSLTMPKEEICDCVVNLAVWMYYGRTL